MAHRAQFYFLTFVLVFCGTLSQAAVNDPQPDFTDGPRVDAPPSPNAEDYKRSVDIAPAPPIPRVAKERLEYFHKYRRGLSILAGGVIDTKRIQNEESMLSRGSIRYLFKDRNLKAYEAGADLDSDGTGAVSISRRWIFSQTRFRPYEKLGLGVRIDPDDQLGTFLRYQHYQIRAAAGFEYLISDPISIRTEVELSASFHSQQAGITAGLVWAW